MPRPVLALAALAALACPDAHADDAPTGDVIAIHIVSRVGTTLNVRLSGLADANLAPPGDYMLFVVDTNGVPSIARFVNVAAAP